MKKFLFSFLLVLSFFFFNLDSSFAANAADIVEENTTTISKSTYTEYDLNMNELNMDKKISSITEVKKVADTTVIIIIFDDGSILIIIIQ